MSNTCHASHTQVPACRSTHEVATWAWMPDEHAGAGLPWFAQRLADGCIDGDLLLQLTEMQLKQVLQIQHTESRQEAMEVGAIKHTVP